MRTRYVKGSSTLIMETTSTTKSDFWARGAVCSSEWAEVQEGGIERRPGLWYSVTIETIDPQSLLCCDLVSREWFSSLEEARKVCLNKVEELSRALEGSN
jgi:hypothetical protein